MPIEVTMPALSPTMEEGNLARWLVKEGDRVAPGDVIAEIETDKATMEVEAVDEGTVARIVVPEGSEGVKVNALIAVLAAEGEDAAEAARAAEAGGKSEEKPAKAEGEPAKQAEKPEKPEKAGSDAAPAADQAERAAQRPAAPKADAAPAADRPAESAAGPAPRADGKRVFSSPLARRLAKEAGIELAAISGSGPHGRIVKADVEAAAEAGTARPQPRAAEEKPAGKPAAPAAAPAPMADEAILNLFEEGSYERVPHDGMRKTIARRLVEAKATVPHFYLTLDCEIDALLALRKQLNDAAPMRKTEDGEKPAYKLSVNDLVIKAMALALMEVPDANASWTEAAMLRHKHADVGVAVAIPGGLITPIVRRAEEKSLSVISNEMKDMAARARNRRLKPEEYQGGTTAVSNLGMYGIKHFSAVINPPHATILAVGAGEQRAVVRDGAVAVATVMSATLSTDHRAVDGALGAELLAAFKRLIENPMGMLV
ncbi:pyruvate dehydrogenase complex dihydrolipoamide acetyltransferase [Aquibium sp. A9E412]|uniref:pyruvate dehydrogenase complex dihydrolipoamide acetyltransferase n=1 Tax=Aquibium sp. A9E412 TaxID=2976767 RepID=UPI0025B24F8E|nr:pyruvate dehydrogenase complex dihydrolipoamide acetyltransferase [Aquibium sp. A9E412]MDN2564674.1 pyruvate dehydrogenase complex dihydrolipoamide acetyltransferase [Aquibium sp. A9E412]